MGFDQAENKLLGGFIVFYFTARGARALDEFALVHAIEQDVLHRPMMWIGCIAFELPNVDHVIRDLGDKGVFRQQRGRIGFGQVINQLLVSRAAAGCDLQIDQCA